MKCILTSNILEAPAFFNFVQDTVQKHSDCSFLVTGDLLNIFPEPGEDLKGSIFYDIYGDLLISEMDRLIQNQFQHLETSPFITPLQQMFLPTGTNAALSEQMAETRYHAFFKRLNQALDKTPFYYIPGNMDYPRIADSLLHFFPSIHQLDNQVLTLDGIRIGALGGVPNTVHPFRRIAEIAPYEMSESEYQRRMTALYGVDVLLTHISPEEYPPLLDFLNQTPLKLLICRAPFNFRRQSDFRGALEVQTSGEKSVIKVRPFDYPVNRAFMIHLAMPAVFEPNEITTLEWIAS